MASKPKVTSPVRKKPSSKYKVTRLDPQRIKESAERRWIKRYVEFLKSLSESEMALAKKVVYLIADRPDENTEPCEVIQFVKGVQS